MFLLCPPLCGATSLLSHIVKVTLSTSFSACSSSHTSSNSIFRSSHGTTENNWIQLVRLKMGSMMGSKKLRLKFLVERLLLCQVKEEKCYFWVKTQRISVTERAVIWSMFLPSHLQGVQSLPLLILIFLLQT